MSDISLTLVLQFKTSKFINDMAKVQIKSEKVTPFGGIFHVRELFSRYMAPIIDKVLGLRCASYGYQYTARSLVHCQASISVVESAWRICELQLGIYLKKGYFDTRRKIIIPLHHSKMSTGCCYERVGRLYINPFVLELKVGRLF